MCEDSAPVGGCGRHYGEVSAREAFVDATTARRAASQPQSHLSLSPPPQQPAVAAVEEPDVAAETLERMRNSSWALLLRAPHDVTVSRVNRLSRERLERFESESDDFGDPDEVGKNLGKKGRLPEGETLVRFGFRDVHTGVTKRLDLESSLLPHLPDVDMAG